jgi:hypothetical protein
MPARKTLTSAEIANAIVAGELDNEFGVIKQAMSARQSVLEAQKAASLKVGGYVRLKGMRPKYVNGMRGMVEAVEGTRVLVSVPQLAGTRFRQTSWLEAKNLVPIGEMHEASAKRAAAS